MKNHENIYFLKFLFFASHMYVVYGSTVISHSLLLLFTKISFMRDQVTQIVPSNTIATKSIDCFVTFDPQNTPTSTHLVSRYLLHCIPVL